MPDWLRSWLHHALIGEIYPEIRAIAAKFSDARILTVRYYLDRVPTGYDRESLRGVIDIVLSNTSHAGQIADVTEECIHFEGHQSEMESLNGFLYARREYDYD